MTSTLPSFWPYPKPYAIMDCIEGMKNLPDNCIDLIVTDPPYGVDYANKNTFLNSIDNGNRIQDDIIGDNLSKAETKKLWFYSFREMGRVMKPGAVIYCFMPQGGDQMMMMMMMAGAGIEPRHELIWVKNNHVLGRVDYAYKHEPILYAWKKGGHKFYGGFQTSLIACDRPNASKGHPTEKPVELIEKLINNSSLEGQVVLDPFLGSGTSLLACRKTDRVGLGFEIKPDYESIIKKRMMEEIPMLDIFAFGEEKGD